jgi:hypothetical protein
LAAQRPKRLPHERYDLLSFKSLGIRVVNIDQSGRNVMHAVIRNYSGKGATKLIDVVEKNKAEVEKLMRPIKGFVSYSLVRTSKGGFSVTVCRTKDGTDESTRLDRQECTRYWCGRTNRLGRHRHPALEPTTFAAIRRAPLFPSRPSN